MESENEILILADERVGTYSQAVALAKELGIPYKIISLKYGILSKLPNFILSNSILRLTKQSRVAISSVKKFPRLVISAGRKSAPIALYLKKLSKNSLKIAQIMRPEIASSNFDFVILPTHDFVDRKSLQNPNQSLDCRYLSKNSNSETIIIPTIGAMNRIDAESIEKEQEKFLKDFENLKKPIIALLVGGSGKRSEFSIKSAKKLTSQAVMIAKNMAATLIVLTSPRTSSDLTSAISDICSSAKNSEFVKDSANASKAKSRNAQESQETASLNDAIKQDFEIRLLKWADVKEKNPYLAVLGFADFFIISGDSVSMISECCSTGKPVYVFDEQQISTKKHRKFHQAIFENGYARKLDLKKSTIESYLPPMPQEAKRVAEILIKKGF